MFDYNQCMRSNMTLWHPLSLNYSFIESLSRSQQLVPFNVVSQRYNCNFHYFITTNAWGQMFDTLASSLSQLFFHSIPVSWHMHHISVFPVSQSPFLSIDIKHQIQSRSFNLVFSWKYLQPQVFDCYYGRPILNVWFSVIFILFL